MMNILKAGCIAIYLLAVASLFVALPWGTGPVLQFVSVALIAVHALEAVFVLKIIKTYNGPLLTSLFLSLLFGLLHWMPLAKASKKAAAV
jgi:hypothetical protein